MLHENMFKWTTFGHSRLSKFVHSSSSDELIEGVVLTSPDVNRIHVTLHDSPGSEFDCELRTAIHDNKWHLVGIRLCGDKRIPYKEHHCPNHYLLQQSLTSIS